nr:glycosyl hydrolase [Kofleriaceae bacterium]
MLSVFAAGVACSAAPHASPDATGTVDSAPGVDGAAIDGTAPDAGAHGHVLLGAYTDQGGSNDASFQALETAVGHALAIENQREPWQSMFDTMDEPFDLAHGVVPMISWTVEAPGGCAKPADIVAGTYDAQLAAQGHALAAFGVPVLVRFYKEFTDSAIDQCFYGDSPAKNAAVDGPKLVAVWQHVVDTVRANGGTNVQWVWGPSANLFSKGDGSLDPDTWKLFYPGDTYVDWMANDNYNKTATGSAYADDPNINHWYGEVSTLGKPLMQSETGAAYLTGSDGAELQPDPQTQWVLSAYQSLPAKFPAMAAFVYWSAMGQQDYRLQGSGAVIYGEMAADPYFSATTLP